MGDISRNEFDELRRLVTGRMGGFADQVDGLSAEVKAALANTRAPSMALRIGSGPDPSKADGGYNRGDFFYGVARARSPDAEEQAEGKAMLDRMGTSFARPD